MKPDDKVLAEAILKYVCVGRRICAVNFYTVPILEIDVVNEPKFESDISLTIESEWRVFDELPVNIPIIQFPDSVVDQNRTSELICAMAYLGWYRIIDARLGDDIPHLLLKFENGKTLFINGHHDMYESWNLSAGKFMIVATPGDEITIWHPDTFAREN
jgi:hypothetical protein